MNSQTDRKDNENLALIFDIKRDCSEDGPGIRTTVFFKGCPLSCVWCQNPEGKGPRPIAPQQAGLSLAGQCELDPADCLTMSHSELTRFYGLQSQPLEKCPAKAMTDVGYWISVEELLYRVLIDKAFFQSSGGGVTVSGGEATLQPLFLEKFLQGLKNEGVSTALETCGFFNYHTFKKRLLPWLDLIYFDLKLMDETAHRQFTGQSNKPILKNLERLLADATIPVNIRVPLIPGITATPKNLSEIASFLKSHDVEAVYLMPYNPLWIDKLEKLGISPTYNHREFMDDGQLADCVAAISQ
ncbi:MAG: glycyl-radical enzyme activating protein [Methylococcales bacterium]|nr:glycyl-radical enzyme activating protein [Methylococcales bacterium]